MTAARLATLIGLLSALAAQCSTLEISGDAQWDHRFALAGVQGSVMAMAFDKKRIYVGGSMQSVGHAVADGVAEINGQRAKALPDGPQQDPFQLNVLDMKMFQGQLCVAGFFTNVDHQAAGGFAVWHGNKWDDRIEITNGIVYALEPESKGGLLLAGRIYLPGMTNPVALARWDGKRGWENLNSELVPSAAEVIINSADQAEALADGNIVVLLELSLNTDPYYGPPLFVLARCDALKNWHNLLGPSGDTNGLDYYTLGKFQGQVVAAGAFTNTTNPSLRNIARWDGAAWQPIGGGLENQAFALAGNERILYAATYFRGLDGFPHTRILRWDGTAWSQVGNDDFRADNTGRIFLGPNDELYYTGSFTGVGSTVAPNLIHWDGISWKPLFEGNYQGLSGPVPGVYGIAEHAGKIFIGGLFTAAGVALSQGIAQWDGNHWQSVGGGIQGPLNHRVSALISSGATLFAGGIFTNMGGLSCSNIAQWDGVAWSPLASGIKGTVSALTMHNGSLVAGGLFTRAGGVAANNIAQWDGSQWQTLGTGCNSNVTALTSWRGSLYAGGRFQIAGGVSARGIAMWDGSIWQDIGAVTGGRAPSVQAFASTPDALYIGGSFTNIGGTPARNLARWNGTNWYSIGDGWPGTVLALAVRGNSVYVGGKWTNSTGQTIHAVRCWNGTNWTDLGSGVVDARGNQLVIALLSKPEALWVGGRFVWAGGKPSADIARWIERPQLRLAKHFDTQLNSSKLELDVDPGLHGRLETSTDLLNWTALPDDPDGSSNWQMDAPDSSGQRFYRAVLSP